MPLKEFLQELRNRNAQPRPRLRKELRRAAAGNQQAYLALSSHYLDFVCEYLYLEDKAPYNILLQQAAEVFHQAWKHIPGATRLSDFEHILAFLLKTRDKNEPENDINPLIGKLHALDGESRLLLVALEMEDWKWHFTGLACRIPVKDIEDRLLDIRCRLCEVNWNKLDVDSRRCLRLISADLNNCISIRRRAELCQELESRPKIKDFKSQWLDLRCELIELRQQIRLDDEARESFSRALNTRLVHEKLVQPQWKQRLKNFIQFSGFTEETKAG